MNQIICMRGIPGSGKTYLAEERYKTNGSVSSTLVQHNSADHYFVNAQNVYVFDRTKIGIAHAKCFYNAIEFVKHHTERLHKAILCIDNTNIQRWELQPYAQLAAAYEWSFKVVNIVGVDPVQAYNRCQHEVPLKHIERMYESLKRSELPNEWNVETVYGGTS